MLFIIKQCPVKENIFFHTNLILNIGCVPIAKPTTRHIIDLYLSSTKYKQHIFTKNVWNTNTDARDRLTSITSALYAPETLLCCSSLIILTKVQHSTRTPAHHSMCILYSIRNTTESYKPDKPSTFSVLLNCWFWASSCADKLLTTFDPIRPVSHHELYVGLVRNLISYNAFVAPPPTGDNLVYMTSNAVRRENG